MRVLTETDLRRELSGADAPEEYVIGADMLVTPAARSFLSDRHIRLVTAQKAPPPGGSALPAFQKPEFYEDEAGRAYPEKPEHMTALYGNVLAPKTHPRIRLRGALDSLLAGIAAAQVEFQKQGRKKLVEDLDEAYRWVGEILRCEVTGGPLAPRTLLGMDEETLREHSHHPERWYGFPHFTPDRSQGEAAVRLNLLRVQARETELAACAAFCGGGAPEREDLIQGLNRLSSLFYVMMLRAKAKEYEE